MSGAVSERRACGLLSVSRSVFRYESRRKEDPKLLGEILNLKQRHCYYGARRVHAVLRKRGRVINLKKVRRLMKALSLCVPVKRRRRTRFMQPPVVPQALRPGDHTFVDWCHTHGIQVHFIDPGQPTQNGYIESFNGKLRSEFLDQHRFKTLNNVRGKLSAWIQHYNEERPHSALDYLTPKAFAEQQASVLVA